MQRKTIKIIFMSSKLTSSRFDGWKWTNFVFKIKTLSHLIRGTTKTGIINLSIGIKTFKLVFYLRKLAKFLWKSYEIPRGYYKNLFLVSDDFFYFWTGLCKWKPICTFGYLNEFCWNSKQLKLFSTLKAHCLWNWFVNKT